MATTAEKNSLASAMASAFAEIESATKDAKNPHFKSNYATLGAVVEAIKPALIKNSLFFTQETHEATGGVCVETVIRHASGQEIRCGPLFVPANKNDAQGFGSALTYARRYSLMTAFGVPAEDDDGNAAAASVKQGSRTNGHANGKIDDAQFAQLQMLIEQSGTNSQAFCEHFKCASVKDLPKSRFDDALVALQKKLKTKEPA